MAFGQRPQNNNGQYNPQYSTPDYNAAQQGGYAQQTGYAPQAQVPLQGQGQQNYQYAQPQQGAPAYQYATQPSASGAGAINTTMTYDYEQARRVSVTKVYGEMTIGLIVTALVAVLGQGAYVSFIEATGMIGVIGLCAVQIGLAIVLGVRITKMKSTTARIMFYVYAALMGFTLSSIFWVYDLGSIGIALGITTAFFFALTMFGMTTKFNMLKAGPILMVGLVVLVVSQLVLMFLNVGGMTQIVCALGLILFSGMTIYDAQSTRALLSQYESQGPEMIKKVSIICALNLYLDFVNMFLYILRLLGSRD
jgi:FtsH-binding integral membrane protein